MKKTYFGIMHVYRFAGNSIAEEWFIHFKFKSKYQGEEECEQHDKDLWDAFWKLKNVSYDEICKKGFASPSAWNYIREIDEVNTDNLNLGKWMNTSPYYYEHTWQSKPKTVDIDEEN